MSESRALVLIEKPKPRYEWATDEEVLEAGEATGWHIALMAQIFGVKRRVMQARIDETPEMILDQRDYVQGIVDDSQAHLFKYAKAGRDIAVTNVLKALGKDRGFGKQDNEGGAIEVVVRQISQEPRQ